MMNVELKRIQNTATVILSLTKKLCQVISVLLVCFSLNAFGSPVETFNTANNFYAAGNYEESIALYQTILKEDNISSEIYFNLGNCYYKTADLPNAILNYEKALKLQPDNEDALFNLKMANKRTIDKIERLPELFIGNSWKVLVTSKTAESWAYFTVGLLFISLLFFLIYLLMQQMLIKKSGFYAGVLFLGLSMFTLLMASQNTSIVEEYSAAIIFASTTTIQSEPNENAEKLFTLHEGTKVILLEQSNEWQKIKLPNGNIGWLKSTDMKQI